MSDWLQPIIRRRQGPFDFAASAAASRVPLEEKLKRKGHDPMKDKLAELEKRAKKAASRARAREARLFTNGAPLLDWERHQEQLRAIRAERNQILAEVRREAEQIEREQRALLEQINDALSPSDALPPFERADAERQLSFAEREIRNLTPAQIRARLESLAASGTKAERFAWTVAAAAYERELLSRRGGRAASHANPAFSTALDKLQTALLGPIFEGRATPVQEAINHAEELSRFCWTRSRGAESMATAFRRQHSAIAQAIERQRYLRGGAPPAPAPEPPSREGAIAS